MLFEAIDRFMTKYLSSSWRTTISGFIAAIGYLWNNNPGIFEGAWDKSTIVTAIGMLSAGFFSKDCFSDRPRENNQNPN
jgi:hypothetical protein